MTLQSAKLIYAAPVFLVSDLSQSIAYYCDKLGFELEFQYEDFYASVARDGCRVHLKWTDRSSPLLESVDNINVNIGVVGIDLLAAQATKADATISVPLREMPYGKEFYVRDPDGYVLGFVEATANSPPPVP